MFNDILPQFGIAVRFVDHDSPAQFRDAINSKTRAIFLETIGNPMLGVPDFDEIASIAQEAHVPVIVDSTFTPPCIFRPMEHGADIVVHSLTKWIGGHGTGIGGVVIDSGKFDWTDPKFRLFNEPEPSYFNIRFGHDLGEDLQPMAYILRMRLVPLRNLGACISPDNSWIFIQGLETLSLRMERHSSNALAVAGHLENHPAVAWVRYPGLPSDPSYGMVQRYFFNGAAGGMVVFGIKGEASGGRTIHQSFEVVFACGECWGREELGDSSGKHNSFPIVKGATAGLWTPARSGALIRRHRGHSRYYRRH